MSRFSNWRWLLVTGIVIAADRYTKHLITSRFELFDRVPVIPYFDLVRLHNTGAAFSFLANASGWQNWFFSGVALAVSGLIIWWLFSQPAGRIVVPLGLTLVLGGAIGNLVDRLQHGYVVDFVLLYYDRWSFPAFNVADSAISVGVILMLFDGFFLESRRLRQAHAGGRVNASNEP
ncbi:MAG: lipoprotein signal peptidase [Chromatiales bacterium]|jgi:signal peptidase II|nr:MAG: lipoprotein signal peptidase [Chromatiales bacterium]